MRFYDKDEPRWCLSTDSVSFSKLCQVRFLRQATVDKLSKLLLRETYLSCHLADKIISQVSVLRSARQFREHTCLLSTNLEVIEIVITSGLNKAFRKESYPDFLSLHRIAISE